MRGSEVFIDIAESVIGTPDFVIRIADSVVSRNYCDLGRRVPAARRADRPQPSRKNEQATGGTQALHLPRDGR